MKKSKRRVITYPLWITTLNSNNEKLDLFFTQIIHSISKRPSSYEITVIKANIMESLKEFPEYKEVFFERFSFSLRNYLNHSKTENWKKKNATKDRVVSLLHKHIQKIEDLLKWSMPSSSKPNKYYPALALYYCYLQEAKEIPFFENHPKKKVFAIKELAEKNKFSWKKFQMAYNEINNKGKRILKKNIPNIERALGLLENYPSAKRIAENDLKLCQTSHIKS